MNVDFERIPTDVLRTMYRDYLEIRNRERKAEAARKAASCIATSVGDACFSVGKTFRLETKDLSILRGCRVHVKNEGRETKIASVSFDDGRSFRMYISKNDSGEFRTKCLVTRPDEDEFFAMVTSMLASTFDSNHVLVDKRRPTSDWLSLQLLTSSLEQISEMTGASLYRLRKISSQI